MRESVDDAQLREAVGTVPAGAWAVAVSGGADSTALLDLLVRHRRDVRPVVVHLNHELRGDASDGDAAFATELAARHHLPAVIALRRDVELTRPDWPANPSARYRTMRHALLRDAVREHNLLGALVAHHADDQAETVLLRLLRGSGPLGLAGMATQTRVAGLLLRRPLLHVRRDPLRAHLTSVGQPWREDASNRSMKSARNRARAWLADRPGVTESLLRVASAARAWRAWLAATAPALGESFGVDALADLDPPVARYAARRWLAARGMPADRIDDAACDRLIALAADAAGPSREQFAGVVAVRRRGAITATPSPLGPLGRGPG
jgi:tRNA(Ile)-lysidine synthetase-like protein